MKHQIATNSDQSNRLLACGLNYKTADMTLSFCNDNFYELMATPFHYGCFNEKDAPAWSLSALLELLPKHLDDFPLTKWYPPFIEDEIWEMDIPNVLNGDVKLYSNGTNWIVDYDWDGFSGTLPQSENPIEAVVLAIELLHANGYTLNTK